MIDILPKNENDVIFKSDHVYVYESNPCVCPIAMKYGKYNYKTMQDESRIRAYNISLPYIQGYIGDPRVGKPLVYFTCSQSPIKSLTDKVYQLILPNINQDGRACLHGSYEINIAPKPNESQENYRYRIFNSFFSSIFNKQLGYKKGWGLYEWEKKTKKDPEWILKTALPTFSYIKSFDDVLGHY